MDKKEFTNKQLKLIIIDLYKSHNINIDDELNKQLNQSSKTQYKKLLKLYNDIKLYIEENISKSSYEVINDNNIEINKNTIETQTDEIKEDIIFEDYKKIKIENFNIKQKLADYKYKILNYKKIIKELNNKKINNNINYSSSNNSDDEYNNTIKEKRKINYNKLTELSSQNIINELSKLSKHNLKQLYNKYFSNKHHRQLE